MPRTRSQPRNEVLISFRISTALRDRIDIVAAAQGRSMANLMRRILTHAVEAHEVAELERRGGGWLERPPSRQSNGAEGDGAAANDDRVGDRRDGS